MKRLLLCALVLTLIPALPVLASCPNPDFSGLQNCSNDDDNDLSILNINSAPPPNHWFLGAAAGYNIINQSLKGSITFGAFAGYQFRYQYRVSLSYDRLSNKSKGNTPVEQNAILMNFDKIISSWQTDLASPYFGAAIGVNLLRHNQVPLTQLAWGINLGCDFTLQEHMTLGIRYRFLYSHGYQNISGGLMSHIISGNLTYSF